MSSIADVLGSDEKVIWEGKPSRFPYMLAIWLKAIPAVIAGIGIALLVSHGSVNMHGPVKIILLAPYAIALLLVTAPIVNTISYNYIYYSVTNKRVLVEQGILVHDVFFLTYSQIGNVNFENSFIDSLGGLKTGTITITPTIVAVFNSLSARQSTQLYHIENLSEVYKMIESAQQEAKGDQKTVQINLNS